MVKKIFEGPKDRLNEIQLYELVANEIENNQQIKGLWAKALADCKGDEKEARGLYIKSRVQMIKDEISQDQQIKRETNQASSRRSEALDFPAELGKPSSGRGWAQKQPAYRQQSTEPFWTWRTKLGAVLLVIIFLGVLGSV
jgi:hypothetical protein